MTAEQLSGVGIDEAIARALGWVYEWHRESRPGQCDGRRMLPHWHDERGIVKGNPPAYSSSVDALREPEAKLIAAGWERETNTDKDGTDTVWFAPGGEPAAWAHDPVEAASRALAVHAGLTAIAAIEEEAK